MATITFKTKPVAELMPDNRDTGVHIVYVPKLDRKHCDMPAFRTHRKYGGFANSTLFPAMLARISREIAPHGYIRTDALPGNVTIDRAGFLWTIKVEV